jgi:SAM-dependent methyltransferase
MVTQTTGEISIRAHPFHYNLPAYWHQILEIVSVHPQTVLEVGLGNGFVSRYLRQRGFAVTTLDIDPATGPDLTASVCAMPFSRLSFDVVACYEVLEHLPFEYFSTAICEIYRLTRLRAVISLPDCTPNCGFEIRIPWVRRLQILLPLPSLKPRVHHADSGHVWEVGAAGYPLGAVQERIRRTGFQISKTYRVFENPYHRFFVLGASPDSDGSPTSGLAGG